MKKLYIIASFIILLVSSCQVINTNDRYIEMPKTETTDRVVLLMDFTGWKCVNCPNAAQTATALLDQYPENLIVVSMHPAGSTFTDPGTSGPDFASQEAMEYLQAFGGSTATALPTGIVDMTKTKGDYFCEYSTWPTAVTDRMKIATNYEIEMDVSEENVTVDFSCISGEPNQNVHLLLWLVEDSIVAPQLTKDEGTLTDYVHRHVFRGCLTDDIWGEEFLGLKQGDLGEVEAELELPELQGEHFAVVAVLVDGDTHEVLQCAEAVVGGGGKPKNPGDFTISMDEEGEDIIEDGDTLYVTEFDYEVWQIGFEGYIHIDNQSDVDFTIVETRDFDYEAYAVTMCISGNCRVDNPNNPGYWGPFEWTAGSTYDFQSHIMFTDEEQLAEPHTFTTKYLFSNGNTANDKTVTVIFTYTPQQTSHR